MLVSSVWPSSQGANKPLAEADRLRHIHPVEARGAPGLVACLDDERRCIGVEAIRVRLEPAEFGLDKDEREGFEQLACAEPGETVVADLDRWLEVIGVARADRAVDAVCCDDQVGVSELGDVAAPRG